MDRQNNRQYGSQQRSKARRTPGLIGRQQLYPFFTRMGTGALSICSVLLISFMAVLYLSQLGQAVTTNQQIQDLHSQQAKLQRQNNDLINTVAQEQAPAYIAAQASAQGLQPTDPQNVQVVVLPGTKGQDNGQQSNQP